MEGNGTKITALYCRLSVDNGNVGDSMSIQSQKAILEKYARKIGKVAYSFYVDMKLRKVIQFDNANPMGMCRKQRLSANVVIGWKPSFCAYRRSSG